MLRGAAGAVFAGGSWAGARKGVRKRAATIQKRNRIKHLREEMELTARRAIPARRMRKRQESSTENTEKQRMRRRTEVPSCRKTTNISNLRAWWRGRNARADAREWGR